MTVLDAHVRYVDPDFERLRHALDSQEARTLYTDETLAAYVRAEQKNSARVSAWRAALTPYEVRVEFDRVLARFRARGAEPLPLPRVLDLAQLAETEPQRPRFVIPDWLPCGEVTLFAGHGGSGKSAIALLAAVCIASGREFYGLQVQRQRIVYFSLEDGADVLHWRLSRVCTWLGVEMAALTGWLTVVDATVGEMSLMIETRDGPSLTSAYAWLKQHAQSVEGIVIDGASDAFDGNENERRAVRRFVRSLRQLIGREGFVLLLAHVDKLTARAADSTQGYSGSTAWSNSVRARWYLRPDGDDGTLLLEVQKANHAPIGTSMRLSWNPSAHLFLGEIAMPATKLQRELAHSDERGSVLRVIREAWEAGEPLPTATRGERTAHSVAECAGLPNTLHGKRGRKLFYAHIEALRQAKVIETDATLRPNRHYREFYKPTAPATEHAPATERDSPSTEHYASATAH